MGLWCGVVAMTIVVWYSTLIISMKLFWPFGLREREKEREREICGKERKKENNILILDY